MTPTRSLFTLNHDFELYRAGTGFVDFCWVHYKTQDKEKGLY